MRENWSRVTAFINRAIAGMEVSPSCARVSVVTFGNAATLQFDLLAHDNAASLHRAIAGLGMLNQSRNLADGISTVRSDVFQDYYGDRQDAPNVCVLITDGNSGLDKQVSSLIVFFIIKIMLSSNKTFILISRSPRCVQLTTRLKYHLTGICLNTLKV